MPRGEALTVPGSQPAVIRHPNAPLSSRARRAMRAPPRPTPSARGGRHRLLDLDAGRRACPAAEWTRARGRPGWSAVPEPTPQEAIPALPGEECAELRRDGTEGKPQRDVLAAEPRRTAGRGDRRYTAGSSVEVEVSSQPPSCRLGIGHGLDDPRFASSATLATPSASISSRACSVTSRSHLERIGCIEGERRIGEEPREPAHD